MESSKIYQKSISFLLFVVGSALILLLGGDILLILWSLNFTDYSAYSLLGIFFFQITPLVVLWFSANAQFSEKKYHKALILLILSVLIVSLTWGYKESLRGAEVIKTLLRPSTYNSEEVPPR